MVDCLHGLWHYCVVGCDDNDREVGHLGTAGTHSGKGFVTRGVQEGYPASVRQLHVVGANVLGYASGLSGDDIGFAYIVQQRGLSVIDVTHHGNHRRTAYEFSVFLLVLLDGFGE